jgi:hypothetical protein
MSSLFTYQPLNGENPIRFLNLLPSELDGAIRCEIHHDDLSNHQPYHAVSYIGGPPEPIVWYKSTANSYRSTKTCSYF